jgi:hypothetical protein
VAVASRAEMFKYRFVQAMSCSIEWRYFSFNFVKTLKKSGGDVLEVPKLWPGKYQLRCKPYQPQTSSTMMAIVPFAG